MLSATTRELDAALCGIAPRIKLLSQLSWPESSIESFLHSWRRGEPELPKVEYRKDGCFAEARTELERIRDAADPSDPIEAYLGETASSYATAARLLDAAGTPDFLEFSRELYGDPYDRLPGTRLTHFEAARQLLDVTAPLRSVCSREEDQVCFTAEAVKREIQRRTDSFFAEYKLDVVIDSNLASKAAASATRVRLRDRTSFTEADIDQLVEHEAFVHSATALNGRLQPIQSFALAAPRTTATQEGLATMAELITGSMDLSRLRRLALRIGAVKHAIEGADFIEVFRYFLRAGQSEDESARSAMRVFRGGDPRGKVAFTKDVVYLHGLIGVHTFLRRAISERRVELIPRLFAGRLTVGDVLRLEQQFERGVLWPGRFVAHWAADPRRLAAHLCFSIVLNRIELRTVTLESILER
ncbi:MAG TPA: flavohemoglobin expression-modulating QEGLA motif protein [Polyangiaceae bacterium]